MNAPRQTLTVLVADDDEDDRGYIKRAWEKSGGAGNLRFVEDGEELIEYLSYSGRYADHASAPRPGLLLLDLNMPRKDGREALREIKANEELRHIPVVVLTTSRAEEDICRSYDLGANSFVTKPVTFGSFADALQVLKRYWTEVVDLPAGNLTV